jgi:UDP-glucose 4-epimerase
MMLTHRYAEPRKPSRVVVLGSNGFIGRALVAYLNDKGVPVLALGRKEIDLTAKDAADRLTSLLQPNDTLVFLAALTPDKGRGIAPFLANQRMGAAVTEVLESSSVGHLIYVSSDAVYPFRSGLINEESCAEPTDLYGAMHLSREIMMRQAAKVPVAVLRPTLIYGVGDSHNSYGPNRFHRSAHNDKRIILFGEGEETRDHIFVGDVVALIDEAIKHCSSGVLNLATGFSIAYVDLANMVAALFSAPIEITRIPRQNQITHRRFDVTAIRRSFPNFKFTSLEEGLTLVQQQEKR